MSAKVRSIQKSRKETTCVSCSKPIPKESKLFRWEFFRGNAADEFAQCTKCGYPKQSQLEPNEDVSSAYGVAEDLAAAVEKAETLEDIEAAVEDAKSGMDSPKDSLQEKIDNMEGAGLSAGDSFDLLNERRDAIEQWVDSLDNVDLDEERPLEELKEELLQISSEFGL